MRGIQIFMDRRAVTGAVAKLINACKASYRCHKSELCVKVGENEHRQQHHTGGVALCCCLHTAEFCKQSLTAKVSKCRRKCDMEKEHYKLVLPSHFAYIMMTIIIREASCFWQSTSLRSTRKALHASIEKARRYMFNKGVLCTANKKRGEEARGFTTVRGAPQNGDGRFRDHAPDGSAALQNLYFFQTWRQNPENAPKKKRATRNRLVYRDDAEGDWASIRRHRENTSRRQAKKLQPLRKPHSASV